jgi:hypothetical protein
VLTNVPGVVAECVLEAGAGYAVAPTGIGDGLRRAVERRQRDGGAELRRMGHSGRSWIAANQTRAMMRQRLLDCLSGAAAPAPVPSPAGAGSRTDNQSI